MDTRQQVYERDAVGWQRGLYADVKSTFRAPIVNWIFRTLMANDPELLRHIWYQVKPVFQTRAFAAYSVAYRDEIIAPIRAEAGLDPYRFAELSVGPAAYRELGEQLATFDVVAPRLAVLFETVDRSLNGDPVGTDPGRTADATAPFPAHLDRNRGSPPTMRPFDDAGGTLESVVTDLRQTHGLDGGLPSIHRCVAQWPGFLDPAWTDLQPVVTSALYETVCADTRALTGEFVEALAHRPKLSPDDLRAAGFGADTVDSLRSLFASFGYGRPTPVLPTLVLYPYLRGVAGPRSL